MEEPKRKSGKKTIEMESMRKNDSKNCFLDSKASFFLEKISGLLSRWHALQLAVFNSWGGDDSLEKSHQFVFDILSWFSRPEEALHVDELESFLHENMLLTFNTDIEDGSIEEIAEQLMIMHEECSR